MKTLQMTEPDYVSVNPYEGCDLVICSKCEHMQYEIPHPLDKGGKYAWECRSCNAVNEPGKIHLLENTARFRSKYGLGGPI